MIIGQYLQTADVRITQQQLEERLIEALSKRATVTGSIHSGVQKSSKNGFVSSHIAFINKLHYVLAPCYIL